MKPSRGALNLLLSLAAVALAVVAWGQYRQLIELRAAQVTFPSPADEAKRLAEANARLDRLKHRLETQQAQAKKAAETAKPVPEAMAWTNTPEAKELFAANRDYRLKIAIDQFYAPLFKKLNLSPEQLAQFKSLISEKKLAAMDAFSAAREQGLAPNSPTVRAAVLQASGSLDAEIQEALGPAAFAQFQQYDSTLPERNAVNLVQQNLATAGAPLSDEQAEQLVQLFAANRPATANQSLGYIVGYATARINASDLQSATAALTPEQAAGVQAVRQQQLAQQQLQQILYQQQHPPPSGKG